MLDQSCSIDLMPAEREVRISAEIRAIDMDHAGLDAADEPEGRGSRPW